MMGYQDDDRLLLEFEKRGRQKPFSTISQKEVLPIECLVPFLVKFISS